MKRLLVLIFVLATCAASLAEPPAVVLFKVKIEYPIEARRKGITGAGTYILNVNPAGKVTSVEVGHSAGSALLDRAAIRAYKQFRFKPGTQARVRVPCAWLLDPQR